MAEQDPESVARALIAAENAGDVEGAVGIFHTDAVCNDATGTHTGHDEIREWQNRLKANHFNATINQLDVSGNTATFAGSLTFDLFTGMGIETPLDATWSVAVEDGKIRTFDFTFSPESAAKLQAAQQQ